MFRTLVVSCSLLALTGCIEIGIGGAFAPNTSNGYITGHEQFHLSLSHRYDLNDRITLESSWHHYSNGAQLGIGRYPNYGMDFVGTQLKFKLFK